ncbi:MULTISPECIES: hypothetical protein [unclassified Luteococcus]|uniref:hypothetical protein n=1 Tax=unclassified Luteococcus TaxID=2639923 RepID=UPI00313C434D
MEAQPTQDFARRLTEAMTHSPLTLEALSARLGALGTPVSIATLSYWRSGRSVPTRRSSLRAVEHLEDLLELRSGRLVGDLPATAAGGWDPLAMLPPSSRLLAVMDQLGLDLRRRTSSAFARDRLELEAGARTHVVRQLVRVEAEELAHLAVMIGMDPGQRLAELVGLSGVRVEELVELPVEDGKGGTLMVGRMSLPRRLVRGERADYGYRYRLDSDQELSPETAVSRPERTPLLVQQVVFGADLPAEVEYVCRPFHSAPDDASEVLRLPAGRHVQYAQRDAQAGVHVIRWR